MASELNIPYDSKLKNLLNKVSDIETVTLKEKMNVVVLEGTFSVAEEAVSVAMGKDRIKDHLNSSAQIITGTHVMFNAYGCNYKQKTPIKVMHIVDSCRSKTMSIHSVNASKIVANDERMHWHDQALWFVKRKRDRASKSIPEW